MFTTIDAPGDPFFTAVRGINGRGQIVGFYGDSEGSSGFLLDHHGFTTFDVPQALNTRALGINVQGDIVGEYDSADGGLHGSIARKR